MEGRKLIVGIIMLLCCLTAVAATDHVVISEVVYSVPGTDSGKEWVELYNPTSNTIDLTGYKLFKESNAFYGTPGTPFYIPSGSSIPPHGYFLIADDGSLPIGLPTPDFITRISILDDVTEGLLLRDKNNNDVDAVGWDKSKYSAFHEGTPVLYNSSYLGTVFSIERYLGEDCGNEMDTNDNSMDFFYQRIPNPQNSNSPSVTPCDVSCVIDDDCSHLSDQCNVGVCNAQNECVASPANEGATCEDGIYCTTSDQCLSGTCSGSPRDCSGNDIAAINTCTNVPDSNDLTLDFYTGFTSVCNEVSESCSTGTFSLSSTCSMTVCGADCESSTDCADTDCDSRDGCVGPHYYDYTDVPNTCNGDCTCTDNSCLAPVITNFDARCTGTCTIDADCDDGLYCNGVETCNTGSGLCVDGTNVDCSANDITGIATCANNPDNNPFTFDSQTEFTSTCNEDTDTCTTGTPELTHSCDIVTCFAECELDMDCGVTTCDQLDGCYGKEWRDYQDVTNICTDCSCVDAVCGDYTSLPDDSRCDNSCTIDSDCDFLDGTSCSGSEIIQTEGVCSVDVCTTQTTTLQDCDDGLFCNGAETCDAGACIDALDVDCSGSDLVNVSQCDYDPDNNVFTLDTADGFVSTCDEGSDSCTTDVYTFAHECDTDTCGAECVDDAGCADVCGDLDGCYEGTFRDYEAIAVSCTGCECDATVCDPDLNTSSYLNITTDADSDTYDIECEMDCDDTNSSIYPGAVEVCNGVDDNCDGESDEGFANFDGDAFGDECDDDDDNDGLPDIIELDSSDNETTDPRNADTDDDGLLDGEEDVNANGQVDAGETDPNLRDTDSDGVIDSIDELPLDFKNWFDTDRDGIGDFNDTDLDGDGVLNEDDTLSGNSSHMKGTAGLEFKVDTVPNPGSPSGMGNVTIEKSGKVLVEFRYNFTNTTRINLRDVEVLVTDGNSTGSITVSGFNLPAGMTKTVYMDRSVDMDTICIKDADGVAISEINALCQGSNEYVLTCPGTNGNYECSYLDATNSTFKISGLKHSAVQQQSYCGDGVCNSNEACSTCSSDCGACPEPVTQPRRSGGGGGGVFIPPIVVNDTEDSEDAAEIESIEEGSVASDDQDTETGSDEEAVTQTVTKLTDDETVEMNASDDGMEDVTGAFLGERLKDNLLLLVLLAAAILAALWYSRRGEEEPVKATKKKKKSKKKTKKAGKKTPAKKSGSKNITRAKKRD